MRHLLHSTLISACLFAVCTAGSQAQELARDINESVTSIDVAVKDLYGKQETGKVVITQFKPDGPGPFPILILNHGRSPTNRADPPRFRYTKQVRYFVERGFAVFEPTRIGYGQYMTSFDPEDSGPCNSREFAPMALAASTQTLAVLDYARQQSYVDKSRVLLVGQSVGGYTTVATAARNPDGLVAAINFAGGSGGDPVHHPAIPCSGGRMKDMYADFGKATKVPTLWIYTENDLFFGPSFSRSWHEAFVKAGGQAEFHLLPPFGKNGHMLFSSGVEIWAPLVSDFLVKTGFPGQPLKK